MNPLLNPLMVQSLRLYHFYCPNEQVWTSASGKFVVGKALHQGEQFSGKVLKQALSECLQIEEDVKNGRLDEKIGVEMILIKYSQPDFG